MVAGVSTTFTDVRNAVQAANRLFVDPAPANSEDISNVRSGGTISTKASYEIGAVVDPQPPVSLL